MWQGPTGLNADISDPPSMSVGQQTDALGVRKGDSSVTIDFTSPFPLGYVMPLLRVTTGDPRPFRVQSAVCFDSRATKYN